MEQCARESIAVGKQLSFHVSFVVASLWLFLRFFICDANTTSDLK